MDFIEIRGEGRDSAEQESAKLADKENRLLPIRLCG